MRKALLRPHPLNVFRWFFAKRYRQEDFVTMAANVRRLYLDRGYLDVSVEIDPAAGASREAVVVVDEGPLYRIDDVEVEGITVFTSEGLDEMARSLSGGSASLAAIDEMADRIEGFYGDRGYINARVRPVTIPDLEDQTVEILFTVQEGQISHLRSVNIRGNSRTRDKVIRRELLIEPGDIYNRARVQRSERRLRNLGFFDTVFTRTIPTSDPGMHDLVFDVSEKRTGQFMVGVGFSSVDNLLGFVELSQGNFDLLGWPYFTGGGQKLRLRAQAGSTRQDYELSFVEPWFLDRKISFGLDLYRRERQFTEYDLKRTGASISLGRALPYASRVNFTYMIEKSVITDISDTNTYFLADTYDIDTGTGEPYLFSSEEDRLKSAFSVSLTQDIRNNPFVPTRGHRIQLFYTLSGGPLAGDIDMFHTGFRHAVYVPLWFGHTVSLRTRAEFVDSFGDTDEVPLAERLFTGGSRSIRGYRYRDIGPKVIRPLEEDGAFQHRPYGGASMFVANLEYTIPIVESVRFVTFYDVGNVWENDFEIDFGDVASSAGIGLRFDLPGFPIRLDRAWPVERDDNFTDEDAWSISIGYDF
jgi:outer membrane protein insertion porin family